MKQIPGALWSFFLLQKIRKDSQSPYDSSPTRLPAKCFVGKLYIHLIFRHNGKTMFGYPVELTWFKDLKKARAKMYEERRQVRRFPPNQRGFRGPEKSIPSPGNYGDARRIRTGSSSSGGRGYRDNGRDRRSIDRRSLDRRSMDRRSTDRRSTERRSVSRSRSFTGSSSRSASNSGRSRSRSVSRTRHSLPSNPGDSMHASESEFNGHAYDDRRASRNLSRRSHDGSSSSSRSSEGRKRQGSSKRRSSNRNNEQYDQSADENSSPDYQTRRNQRVSRSPSVSERNLAYSNAPAPNPEDGSSLGFEQASVRDGSFSRRTRHSSENSSSGASVASSNGAFDSPRNRSGRKRVHSISPPYNDVRNRTSKAKAEAASNSDEKDQPAVESQKRRKTRNAHSPANNTESLSEPPHTRSKTQRTSLQKTSRTENSTTIRQANADRKQRPSAAKANKKSTTKDSPPTIEKSTSKNSHNSRRSDTARSPLSLTSRETKRWRTPEDEVNDDHLHKEEKWPSTINKLAKLKKKSAISSANNSSDNDHSDTSKVDGNQVTISRNNNVTAKESLKPLFKKSSSSSNNNNQSVTVGSASSVNNEENESGDCSDDVMNLIRDRKDALAEDYKRDCEAFTTVVRMLIR
uniref:FHA domain-containing protein n=1 Tax=Schistosoma mansoni TaxID=6183 RepID=A0A3Q0KGG8_SCHMA